MNVSEVRAGDLDAAGVVIESVFVKNAPHYAIYRTHERVAVHLADDGDEKKRQQEALAPLNPLRGEINGLIDGWRKSVQHDKVAMTRLFDRRVADGLALVLEGDSDSGKKLLASTLDDIAEERRSKGRIEHLAFAAAASALVVLIATIAVRMGPPREILVEPVSALLVATAIGGIGALVSIAIKVQDRSLTTDLQTRDNVADAVLRVVVGAIGAALLIAMLRSDLIQLSVGGVDLDATNQQGAPPGNDAPAGTTGTQTRSTPDASTQLAATNSTAPAETNASVVATPEPAADPAADPGNVSQTSGGTDPSPEVRTERPQPASINGKRSYDPLVFLIVAFFGGFLERVVSRLSERIQFRDVAATLPAGGAGAGAAGGTGPGGGASTGGGTTGGGGGNGGGGNPLVLPLPLAGVPGDSDTGADEHADGCLAEHDVAEEDATDDTQLPAAAGGVEEPRAPTV